MSTAEHHARAWTDALAESVLEPLLPATQERLQLVPWIRSFDSPRLASSALMARVASGYSLGETPDDLIGRLASAAAHDGRSLDTDVATAIVLTAVQMVRLATLPDPRWWEPLLPHRTAIERGLGDSLLPVLERELDDFMGERYEAAFREHPGAARSAR